MAYTIVGNMTVEWDDNDPLFFSLSEYIGAEDDRRKKIHYVNLTHLRTGFEETFLLNLKEMIVDRRLQVSLTTIETESKQLILLLQKVINCRLFTTKRSVIDETFLLSLNTITDELSNTCLKVLKRYFRIVPHAKIFDQGLREDDFPIKLNKRSEYGQQIKNILSKALNRTTCVEILSRSDEAYEDGIMGIGHFSFINLAFHVFVRPDSYRRIRISDLVSDTDSDSIFLYIAPAKPGIHSPQKICYRINKHVGILLIKQRQDVIKTFGHLVSENDISNLALFPSRQLKHDKSGWVSEHANEFFGEYENGGTFSQGYFKAIKTILNGKYGLTASALRHTIGTQMAEQGCSAKTIQAVLKHVDDSTCLQYVDIAFQGLINELSDAMQPTFEAHFPVFQRFLPQSDVVASDKTIYSENLKTGRIELTGECGKQIRCQAAPFTCYECNKFIPCFDADHGLNIDIIESEIDIYKQAGKAYQHLVEKAKRIKYRIQLVIAICAQHQQAFLE
ncbi:tyrosine-type recombinase/integrase [Oryzomonas rubra]|uniref:Site-specific integrase n=1 Tax=Oryzomonas rubra TaxID=2509454 RepID=A0A5A9XPS5_9BACT|nr:tyrosine-type recombinase/integrase [Oryzomonas rubra]KAA0894248.1 site-specific integrase [Oryzomonas rubra]